MIGVDEVYVPGVGAVRRGYLRSGMVAEGPAKVRKSDVEVETPCCQVTYRIKQSDIDAPFYQNNPIPIMCGKVQNGRGRRGDGCEWPYGLTFERDADGVISLALWRVGP